jgi:hypothetical protein
MVAAPDRFFLLSEYRFVQHFLVEDKGMPEANHWYENAPGLLHTTIFQTLASTNKKNGIHKLTALKKFSMESVLP